jgi:glutathione reductase (NADPH)
MTRHYDLIAIGTGSAASAAATRCRAAGLRVAVIDRGPLGGTCALRGCVPKKVLVGVSRAVDSVARLRHSGVTSAAGVDWPAMMAFKRRFTDPIAAAKRESFAGRGIDLFEKTARFIGPGTIDVDGEVLEAGHVLIATGAAPLRLGIEGEAHLVTSDAFLSMEQCPAHVVLVGGGYIAFEFAHVARRAGARVTMLEQGSEVLRPFEPDVVEWLVERTREIGIEVCTDTPVERIEAGSDGRFHVTACRDGTPVTIDACIVVHAAGRVPALDSLGLDAAGVATRDGRLCLNEYLQSVSNPRVYAAGDAAQQGPPLTPVASRDGDIAAVNIIEGNHARPDYAGVPSVVFTTPPLGSVGLTERDARAAGLRFRVLGARTGDWFSSRHLREPASGYKVLLEEGTERILGAHLLGPHAEEVINVFALAVRLGLSADALRDVPFAFPTGASDISDML